ncbi:hypothetical protein ASE01_08380 [Nocardioides sp. Root190]|uniref:CPCC family cysteine-rich protein n=1 Tax=Nocardioides sp. Root190 TaxID=1736488 RepID=UPI0006F7A037|nr:CPCC family cysteine-rich protein [Nocardioides sp. Root190]KRB78160.1 hypothetical protein ASE01_08380 [Nocardioides sp. Root190]
MNSFPCPCCGHLTLDSGPGDYELCPVCRWEDDGGQLRYPMHPDGANGISLMEAQRAFATQGAKHKQARRRARRPRSDEPLDEGWRPFDPELDWSNPVLDGDQWPVNHEALYYWRATYWNGDQHKLPRPPAEPTDADRFLETLRHVPELRQVIAESERRWGVTHPFDVCSAAAEVAAQAYREGDEEAGLRIVEAMLPALDEGSATYAPNCVVIAFLEDEVWHEAWVQQYVDRWPPEIRDDLREQQTHVEQHTVTQERKWEDLQELFRSGRGQPVETVVDRLRATTGNSHDDPRSELGQQVVARFISNPWWVYRHPIDSLTLAWRSRALEHPLRTLKHINRPRISG